LGLGPEVQPVAPPAAPGQGTAGRDAVRARGEHLHQLGTLHLAGDIGQHPYLLGRERAPDEEGPAIPGGDSLAVGAEAFHCDVDRSGRDGGMFSARRRADRAAAPAGRRQASPRGVRPASGSSRRSCSTKRSMRSRSSSVTSTNSTPIPGTWLVGLSNSWTRVTRPRSSNGTGAPGSWRMIRTVVPTGRGFRALMNIPPRERLVAQSVMKPSTVR